jgi:PAS domain S-box-containing protein
MSAGGGGTGRDETRLQERARAKEGAAQADRAQRRLQHLYEISKLLMRFESVDRTVPKILGLFTETVPVRIAMLMLDEQGEDTRTRVVVWRSEGTSQARLQAAMAHAQTAYGYLRGSTVELHLEAATGESPLSSITPPSPDAGGNAGFVVLPLVVEHGRIFGALQVESAEPLDEADLMFVNAVVNQLAIALDRLASVAARQAEAAAGQAAAERKATQLSALLENLSDGVVVADESGRVLMINDAARAILGFGDADVRSVDAIYSLEAHDLEERRLPNDQRPLSRALRGEQFVDDEMMLSRPNGERRRVVSTGTSVRDENGNVALAIVVYRDVTELRRLQQQHDEYLALISHDLRNPLGSIVLFVQTLKQSLTKKGLTEDVSIAERVERNVWRVHEMLEELTEATNLESRSVALQRKACDLQELVVGVVDRMEDARARRITIETDDSSSYVVRVEAPLLERVVANLLTNALKYSAQDAPVTARLARKENAVELDVIDRGIGIAPESVKMLFDRYYRTTGGKSRASGLGLGLYIARLIVEAHGGRIDVSSELGKGSTFRLILPSHTVLA